jgi:hypothetical protein
MFQTNRLASRECNTITDTNRERTARAGWRPKAKRTRFRTLKVTAFAAVVGGAMRLLGSLGLAPWC